MEHLSFPMSDFYFLAAEGEASPLNTSMYLLWRSTPI